MKIEDVLKIVLEKMEECNIDYMITGSFASNLHGIPRTTFDADIVISADFKKIKKFAEKIEKDFYTDLNMTKEAIEQRRMFNIIHYETGFKVDFIIKKTGPFYEKEFQRRKSYHLAGKPCFFASPEDTILSKLLWAQKSESERQLNDAVGVAKIQADNLDYEYLEKWAGILGIAELLDKLIGRLKP